MKVNAAKALSQGQFIPDNSADSFIWDIGELSIRGTELTLENNIY